MTSTNPPPPRSCRPCARRVFLIAVVIAIAIYIWGAIPTPTGPATGYGAEGAYSLRATFSAESTFRVATLNMHSGVGEDNVFNIQRTIDSVRHADLCALQEVRGYYFSATLNQAQLLAEQTNHAWLYEPTERRFWHDEFGNGLLTRMPIEGWSRIPLPTQPQHAGYRNLTIARVEFADRPVNVLFAHIDRAHDQTNQLMMTRRLFEALQPPSLLLADLNSTADNPQVQAMLAIPGVHDCIHESSADAGTHDRIDWILSRGFETQSGGRIQNGASDHPAYWADLKFATQPKNSQ
jgi:endonuclease/exonuclease/phosphatase family metal-dependent hydrolase